MKVENGAEVDFRECLYKAQCEQCGQKLTWEADFDADGTNYHAHCCQHLYTMEPATVRCTVENDE